MNERDFQVNGISFKLNKIDAIKQFHIVRRIAPILADLLPAMGEVAKLNKPESVMSESEKFDQIAKMATPIMSGLSKLSDQDSNKVLYGLLSSVEMQQSSGGWAWVANDSAIMFQDLELPTLFQLAGRAFVYNMAGFFKLLPSASNGGK